MATYLRIDSISGNVKEKSHQKWIELHTLTFKINRHISTLPGQVFDRQLSRPAISEVDISKYLDNSSVLLFQASCSAKAISKATIDICQSNQMNNAYASFTLNNIIVTEYCIMTRDKSTQQRPLEQIKLSFDHIEFRYTPFNTANKAMSPASVSYDLKSAVLS